MELYSYTTGVETDECKHLIEVLITDGKITITVDGEEHFAQLRRRIAS